MKTILITSATGRIGSKLTSLLLKEDVKLVLLTSNAARLQASERAIVEEGNIKDPRWIESLLRKHNVDNVFLCLTGLDESVVTFNFFDAMRRAGTKRLVYVSAAGDFVSEQGFNETVRNYAAANVLAKVLVEKHLQLTDFSWTTLGPTLFWDNDLVYKDAVLNGVYPSPTSEQGVSHVSPADIAQVAANALLDDRWIGKKIGVGSKQLYGAAKLAELWSAATGKDITVAGAEALDQLEETLNKYSNLGDSGPADARMIRSMIETFVKHGFSMTDEQYELQVECLGREPLQYEQFVKETAKEWLK